MKRSLAGFAVCLMGASVVAWPELAPAAAGSDFDEILTLPCTGRSFVDIASLGPGGASVVDVYDSQGKLRQSHGGLDFGVDGATRAEVTLPEAFLGSCVISSDVPIAASVVRVPRGGTKSPIGLPAGTKGGSNLIVSATANEAGTVATSALFLNPTGAPRGIDNFCNDLDNNLSSVSHWEINAFGNQLMEPFLANPELVLDLSCAQVFTPPGGAADAQWPSSYGVTDFKNSGDRLFVPGVYLPDLLGRTQILPLVYGSADGSIKTSLKVYNIGPGESRVRLSAYTPDGKRSGKRRTVRVPEGKSVVIDSATEYFDADPLVVVRGTRPQPRSVIESIVSINVISTGRQVADDGPAFGAALPTYTPETAFTERAAIPGLSFANGDAARIGVVNAGAKKARVRVRVLDDTGATWLNEIVTMKRNGSASVELPDSLAGLALHVVIDVLKKGPVLAYAEEHRASGEIDLYAAQPFLPAGQ